MSGRGRASAAPGRGRGAPVRGRGRGKGAAEEEPTKKQKVEAKPLPPVPQVKKTLKPATPTTTQTKNNKRKSSSDETQTKKQKVTSSSNDARKRERAARTIQRAYRTKRFKRQFEQLVYKNKQRKKVADELLATERTYVTHLSEIIKVFKNPLLEKKLITSTDAEKVFSNVQQIYDFHSVFAMDLLKKMENWTSGQTIGDVFLKLAPFMKIYQDYINNFNISMETIKNLRTVNKKFVTFLESCTSKNMGAGADYLKSLMIVPVQRTPRYELLLKELLKFTPEAHEDYQNLNKAYSSVKTIVDWLNERKKKEDEIGQPHKFELTSFAAPTWCACCNNFIWGFTKQGYSCSVCGIASHKKCLNYFSKLKDCKILSPSKKKSNNKLLDLFINK